ncbi:MAG: serpin family protein [Candidatus Zixiibacteriota bacterium]|nr:MAG: serpin family protein [candidate division Zixibacteria bacterium]
MRLCRTFFIRSTIIAILIPVPLAIAGNPESTIQGNTEFAFRLFDKITGEDYGENVFFSPLSISLALTMVYNGADGETKAAMARALALEGIDIEQVNESFRNLMTDLPEIDPSVTLEIANSIWARQRTKFDQHYMKRVKDHFDAEITTLDFSSRSSVDRINDWVGKKTHDKIKDIISQLNPEDVMILINAIYFKGAWSKVFDAALTENRDFHLLDGKSKQHPMMTQTDRYDYYHGPDFQAISLPYGRRKISMYIFLPGEGVPYDKFLAGMDKVNWEQGLDRFHNSKGTIVLPKFKLEYQKQLNDILKSFGMGVAFDANLADFSKMNGDPAQGNISISEVMHKAFVEVNEEGTEAAAVTSVRMALTAAVPEEPFEMIVDRPFMCAIRDNITGTILFMGAIVDPT